MPSLTARPSFQNRIPDPVKSMAPPIREISQVFWNSVTRLGWLYWLNLVTIKCVRCKKHMD